MDVTSAQPAPCCVVCKLKAQFSCVCKVQTYCGPACQLVDWQIGGHCQTCPGPTIVSHRFGRENRGFQVKAEAVSAVLDDPRTTETTAATHNASDGPTADHFTCRMPGCGRSFPKSSSLKRHHTITHTLRDGVLPIDKTLSKHTSFGQARHARAPRVHTASTRRASTSQSLTRRSRRGAACPVDEAPEFTCSFGGCSRSFPKRSSLLKHAHHHAPPATGQKAVRAKAAAFTCTSVGCEKSFANHPSLLKHAAVHKKSSKPNFVCPVEGCHRPFLYRSQLLQHTTFHQTQANGGGFTCPTDGCDRTVPYESSLRQHACSLAKQKPERGTAPPPFNTSNGIAVTETTVTSGPIANGNHKEARDGAGVLGPRAARGQAVAEGFISPTNGTDTPVISTNPSDGAVGSQRKVVIGMGFAPIPTGAIWPKVLIGGPGITNGCRVANAFGPTVADSSTVAGAFKPAVTTSSNIVPGHPPPIPQTVLDHTSESNRRPERSRVVSDTPLSIVHEAMSAAAATTANCSLTHDQRTVVDPADSVLEIGCTEVLSNADAGSITSGARLGGTPTGLGRARACFTQDATQRDSRLDENPTHALKRRGPSDRRKATKKCRVSPRARNTDQPPDCSAAVEGLEMSPAAAGAKELGQHPTQTATHRLRRSKRSKRWSVCVFRGAKAEAVGGKPTTLPHAKDQGTETANATASTTTRNRSTRTPQEPKSDNTRPLRRHTGQKLMYRCDARGCGRQYTTPGSLNRHVDAVHVLERAKGMRESAGTETSHRLATVQAIYTCFIRGCVRQYTTHWSLHRHVDTVHRVKRAKESAGCTSGQITYKCRFKGCEKQYTARSTLNRHVDTMHKRYLCTINNCGQRYTSSPSRSKHQTDVHGYTNGCSAVSLLADKAELTAGPYICKMEQCGLKYARKHSLIWHYKQKHGILT
ncbi:hypothetical protein SARC_01072 [Sphaeroforma arctica JP610]|uniref:Uncharacterized protein n=1 Tax=Sphaeroforma arctica JP610 TaxID=667725 RepID=A0A0L0GET2_9EUKA|nr:hypothetical protein SARC_01072 [Sphaeroforma arctica JP610]KNC86778.1 hypothetical protein SARC_01072 [Sphaeroforma arctica JP610]|eukprot:XP_014160680.1 hypothetical protein SARC_01072 [Sphaeroforma arctica JP610]